MGFVKKEFINQEGEKNLLSYKYSGSDSSYIYKYILSPLSQALVDKVLPPWLA
jgi:hypothetical protein